jgi:hypothetical protein
MTTSSAPGTLAGLIPSSEVSESRQTQTAPVRRYTSGDRFQGVVDSDSDDSVTGTATRRQAILESATSHTGYSSVEPRLYHRTNPTLPGINSPVYPHGPWFLTSDCTTSHDYFARICERIGNDCSFMIIRLPVDMSQDSSIRLDRCSGHSELVFI